jgi:glutathione S-transferase
VVAQKPKIYVIPGSHPCRTGMLMLEHKGIAYDRRDLVPGMHSVAVRVLGFPAVATRRTEQMGEGKHRGIALADRLGTVPALRYDGERVQTNREIARFLDRVVPDPPLFPADAEKRRAVEEAERWGDEELQMPARRLTLAGGVRGLVRDDGDDGRMGPILFHNRRVRRVGVAVIARAFEVDERAEAELLEALPGLLDRVDAWIADGVLNGDELNAADYMIVTSLALMSYRTDLAPEIAARPAGRLVDRVLPEPVQSA